MINLIFSLDYEIYGTGKGDFDRLMISPTNRMLDLFDTYNAKLSIMTDVAEIIALQKQETFAVTLEAIEKQLKRAVNGQHDVQLHLHPAWFNAQYLNNIWQLDFNEYSLVGLSSEKIDDYIHRGKAYLTALFKNSPDYACVAYRAGNWLMQPSQHVVSALEQNGFKYDTSVYKWGYGQAGDYTIDYRDAYSEILPWYIDPIDINCVADRKGLMEIPILCREVFITSMLTPRRLMLQRKLRQDSQIKTSATGTKELGSGKSLTKKKLFYPKKFDFCRLSFREMKQFLHYAERRTSGMTQALPVVAIGHSTEFIEDGELEKFLDYVKKIGSKRVSWTTFNELHLNGFVANQQ